MNTNKKGMEEKMKQLHKNKCLYISLILVIIFLPLGNSLSVIAGNVDSSVVESTNESVENKNFTPMNNSDEEKSNESNSKLSDSSSISETYDSFSEKEKAKIESDMSDNSKEIDYSNEQNINRLNPDNSYPGPVLAGSKSGDSIMYGEPNLFDTMQGDISTAWWRTINHLVSRRVIENFLNDRLNSSSEYELGYRKGDKVTVPLNMGFWEGSNLFDKPSGINFTGRTNISGGGQPYFEQIVPSMSNDRVKINNGNDYSIMIDAWDIPNRPSSWTDRNFRSALSTNSTQPEHASLVPIFASRNGSNSVTYPNGNDNYKLTFYGDSSNSQWLEIERLNTTFEPNNQLPFEIYIGYYGRYNTFNSNYIGSGKYNWNGYSLSTETGKFTAKGDVRTEKPDNLSIIQKSIPTYKVGQKITSEEIKKYVDWSGNHSFSEISILGDNLDYTISSQDLGEKKLDFTLQETLDDKSRSINFEFKFNVDAELNVEMKQADILLGTNTSFINPKGFIESVKLGNTELSSQEYDAEFVELPNTTVLGISQTKIRVSLKNSSKSTETSSEAKIIWGSTIVSRANSSGDVDVSVSLLDKEGTPYLNANKGFGFSNYEGLLSRPNLSIHRNKSSNQILNLSYGTVKNSPEKLAELWNQGFNSIDSKYGDVVKYSVNNYGSAGTNSKGSNTWISRNDSLVRETQGYDEAYYELTKDGYRLMNINQLVVNNSNKIPLNISQEEMDENVMDFISIPSHISNPKDYRMEFESVDTSTSGKKTSTIKVYQRLQSGGEFMTTYSVNYTVNPEIEETDYDVEGNKISETKKTSFDYGTQFIPSPTKYLEKEGILYAYKGWLEENEVPGIDTPRKGIPEPTKIESKLNYIYEKADKYISVTIPTEIVFGTFDNTEVVKSKKYGIKNNSKEFTTNVSLESFREVKTSVKLLGENEAPDETKDSARLNLLINDEPKIKGLNETKRNISLVDIEPENTANMGIDGEYYAKTSKINIVEYKTILKFKAVSGK
ncbi:TPA: hypothetical protein ACN1ND_002439 [Enterococcus faecalis]